MRACAPQHGDLAPLSLRFFFAVVPLEAFPVVVVVVVVVGNLQCPLRRYIVNPVDHEDRSSRRRYNSAGADSQVESCPSGKYAGRFQAERLCVFRLLDLQSCLVATCPVIACRSKLVQNIRHREHG